MAQQQKEILQLVQNRQFEAALTALKSLKSDLGWKDVLELRVLRLLKQGDNALKLANALHENKTLHQQKTDDNQLLRFIALIFSEQGKLTDALKIYTTLCSADQGSEIDADLLLEYGTALSSNGDLDAAEKQLRLGCQQHATNVNFHSQLGRIYCRTGRVQRGIESYQRAAFLEPKKPQHLQRLAYWTNYSDTNTQQSNFQLARLWAKKAYPKHQTGSNTWRDANPDKPLKIGFVSADFCAHAVSFFITPLLKNIDHTAFQIFAYSDVAKPDSITKEIKTLCDTWHDASGQGDDLLGAQMGADQLDVLIDLSGHSANNRLGIFSQHIAPIQISWLGYPSTTGLDSINFRITDNIADPISDSRDYFTEELIRLGDGFLCYQPHEKAPAIKKTSIAAKNTQSKGSKNAIRFGSFNNLAKISSITLDAWAATLLATPKSTLYIKRQQLINNNVKQYLVEEFAQRGIAENRLILKTSKAKIQDHLAEYNDIDIALDTSPYNGTTTTLEALWMGTPVISLSGQTHASRVSASILNRIGLDDLVVTSVDDFATTALSLSKDKKRLIKLSKSLRNDLENSALLNYQQFTQQFCNAIQEKWTLWCYARNKEQGVDSNEKIIGISEKPQGMTT